MSLKRSGELIWFSNRREMRSTSGYPTKHCITDASLIDLAKRCHHLEELSLACCSPGPCATLLAALGHASSSPSHRPWPRGMLMLLVPTWCPRGRYTDAGVIAVAQACPLKRLDVKQCPKLSDATLCALRGCTHLQWLNIDYNVRYGRMTDGGVESLVHHTPNLLLGESEDDGTSLHEFLELEHQEIRGISDNRPSVAEQCAARAARNAARMNGPRQIPTV